MQRGESTDGRRVAIEAMDVARVSTTPLMNKEEGDGGVGLICCNVYQAQVQSSSF